VYGKLGIKVWLFRGEILGKRDLSPNVGVQKGGRGSDRGGRRQNDRRSGGRGGSRPNRGGGDRR